VHCHSHAGHGRQISAAPLPIDCTRMRKRVANASYDASRSITTMGLHLLASPNHRNVTAMELGMRRFRSRVGRESARSLSVSWCAHGFRGCRPSFRALEARRISVPGLCIRWHRWRVLVHDSATDCCLDAGGKYHAVPMPYGCVLPIAHQAEC